jgi:predicted membrane-bound spermidine synthase
MKIEGDNKQLSVFAAIFLLSGAAGLIYEVVWERLLELYFGVTYVSIILIISAYMAGLGLGSLAGGQASLLTKKPILVYGLIELGIAFFGIFSPSLIVWIGSATAGSPYPLVFLISFAVLLVPTFLMGMTLPLLSQAFVRRVEMAGEIVGLLYGINTLGAALGALLAGFLLIGWMGLNGSAFFACGLNAAAGIAALALHRMGAVADHPTARVRKAAQKRPARATSTHTTGYATILVVSGVVGFLGLGYEILWIRILAIINKNTVYGFPAILGIFLIGLALGGYYFGKKADSTRDVFGLFWKLETCVAVVTGLSILAYYAVLDLEPVQSTLQNMFREAQRPGSAYILAGNTYVFSRRILFAEMLFFFIPILWLVLPAGFLMGGGLPVLDRMAIQNADLAGKWVGNVHLANIIGSVAGTLIVGFLFLDRLGSEWTLKILILLSLGFILLGIQDRLRSKNAIQPIQAAGLLSVIFITGLLPGNKKFYERYFQAGTGTNAPLVEEYADGVLALTDRFLWIRGDEHGSYPSDGSYEHNILACLGAAHPKRVLIIGLGGGNTAFFLSKAPGIEHIVIVELMEGLDEFLDMNVPIVHELLADPRVTYITDDGRRYLYSHPDEKYDLISIDPLRNFTSGHDSLYSVEAQELYREHLTENGIFCEWHDENNIIPNTTAQVFPVVDTFRTVSVAANAAIRYDVEYMNEIVTSYLENEGSGLQSDAGEHLQTNKVLLAFVRDRSQILEEEKGTPILTDLTPWLEYYLFREPEYRPLRTGYDTFNAYIQRLEGCTAECSDLMKQKADKLK